MGREDRRGKKEIEIQTERGKRVRKRDKKDKDNADSKHHCALYTSLSSVYSNSVTMPVVREAAIS